MDYVAMGNIITNSVTFPDGTSKEDLIGGSVLYAAAGIRLWTENCLVVSNAGADFQEKYSEWFRENGLSAEGIGIKSDHTVYQILKYQSNGVYDISYEFGDGFGMVNFGYMRATPEEILRHSKGAKGVYMQLHADKVYFDKLLAGKREQGFRMLWEYLPNVSVPDALPLVSEILKQVDIFSINYPESCELFGTEDEKKIIEAMKELHVPLIVFRVGARGLYTIAGGRHWFVPSVGSGEAVDPTGCGNCSTGASLYGFCEGYDPLTIGIMANVAASYTARQYGPYPKYTQQTRAEAWETCKALYEKYQRETTTK